LQERAIDRLCHILIDKRLKKHARAIGQIHQEYLFKKVFGENFYELLLGEMKGLSKNKKRPLRKMLLLKLNEAQKLFSDIINWNSFVFRNIAYLEFDLDNRYKKLKEATNDFLVKHEPKLT